MKWIIKILAVVFGIIGLLILYFSIIIPVSLIEKDIIFKIIFLSVFLLIAIFCLLLSWLVIKKYRDEDVKALSISLGIIVYSIMNAVFRDNQLLLSNFDKKYIDWIIYLGPMLIGIICYKIFYTLYLRSKENKSNKEAALNANSSRK
jgi:predicted permease